MEALVLVFAVLALLAGAFVFSQLLRAFAALTATTALGFVGVFFGFTLALLLDLKFVALAASFVTYVFSVEGGRWGFYGAALAFYLFTVCSMNVLILMVENLRKTTLGNKVSFLKPLRFNFDALGSINSGLPDVLRMGVAFWGGLGLFIAFFLLFFIASHWYPRELFAGNTGPLTLTESYRFALQISVDSVPVLHTALKEKFSALSLSWSLWQSKAGMFLVLSYQFLIYPAAFNFVVKLWQISHKERPSSLRSSGM